MAQAVSALSGIQHAFQTQLKREDEAKGTTKIVGFKTECKTAVLAARNWNTFKVSLCQRPEGKELWRRLTDEATFGGRA